MTLQKFKKAYGKILEKTIIKEFLFLLALLIVFIAFRAFALTIIPVFADEAIYIHWAQRAWHNQTERFISFSDGKPPLHTWLLIPFLKIFEDPLIAGRLLSVTAGIFTLVGAYLFARLLFGKKTAIFTGIFALLSPFLFFYDRLAVADSLLSAFYIWSGYLMLKLSRSRDLGTAFLLAFVLAGGMLTKQSSVYAFTLAIPAFYLLRAKNNNRVKSIKTGMWILLSLALGYSIFLFIVKLAPNSHLLSSRTYDYILGKREWLSDPFQRFKGNLNAILTWTASYQTFSWLILLPVIFALKKHKEKLVIIFWAVLLPIIGSAFIGRIIFPRYFLPIQPYLSVLFGLSFCFIWQKIGKYKYLLLLLFIQAFYFDYKLITNPVKAPLHIREQDQYLTTWSAGFGVREIADYLKKNYQEQNVQVYTEGYFGTLPDGLLIYLDRRQNVSVQGIGQPIYEIPDFAMESLQKQPTFLIVNNTRISLPDEQKKYLKLIESYPKPEFEFLKESLMFYQIQENEKQSK